MNFDKNTMIYAAIVIIIVVIILVLIVWSEPPQQVSHFAPTPGQDVGPAPTGPGTIQQQIASLMNFIIDLGTIVATNINTIKPILDKAPDKMIYLMDVETIVDNINQRVGIANSVMNALHNSFEPYEKSSMMVNVASVNQNIAALNRVVAPVTFQKINEITPVG